MVYKINPKNNDKLSILGFGCMRFAGNDTFIGKFNAEKAEGLIKSAVDKGINYFDTAYIYNGSEEVLGKTLAKYDLRKKVYIATKLPLIICRKKADLDRYFNTQLSRLQTDYIDYYLLHMLSDMGTWEKLVEWGIVDWIKDKKASGQIRQIGFSFHGSQSAFMTLLEAYDWDFVQIQYNYSDENYQAGVKGLKKASSKGIPVIVMEPLLGGKLADGLPPAAVAHFKEVDPKLTPVDWALRWLWNQPEVSVVLSGMNEMQQLDDNIKTADSSTVNMLNESELNAYTDVKKIFNQSNKIPCTGCHYCTPCPHGVDIPGCFSAYNIYSGISKRQGALQYSMGTLLSGDPGYASLCKRCGKCEKHCPQNIPIVKSLAVVSNTLENLQFKVMRFGIKIFKGKKRKSKQ